MSMMDAELGGVRARPAGLVLQQVNVSRLDVPFLTLTWFFVKASFAAALAAIVTSVIWLAIWTAMVLAMIAILTALGVAGMAAGAGDGTAQEPPPTASVPAPRDQSYLHEMIYGKDPAAGVDPRLVMLDDYLREAGLTDAERVEFLQRVQAAPASARDPFLEGMARETPAQRADFGRRWRADHPL